MGLSGLCPNGWTSFAPWRLASVTVLFQIGIQPVTARNYSVINRQTIPNAAPGKHAPEVYGDFGQDFRPDKLELSKGSAGLSDLPGIQHFDSEGRHDGIVSGALRIGADLLQRADNEAVHHPDRLLGKIRT